jgi:hypothetical protein
VIVSGLEIVTGKRAENGAWFGDVLEEKFIGEVGEQRVHDGSFGGLKIFTIPGTQKMVEEKSFRFAQRPFGFQ